jgi:hypothetical protein
VETVASHNAALDRTVVDIVKTYPDGTATEVREYHRLGDYFDQITIQPKDSISLEIVFHLRENAGRFSKDLLVHVLHNLKEHEPSVLLKSITRSL